MKELADEILFRKEERIEEETVKVTEDKLPTS
jgi:hypothetical protein